MAHGRLAAVDRPALQAGIRAAAAVSAGFAIGRYALDDPQFAVFAAFTAMALLAFADYGGPIRLRLVAFAVTVAVALALVSLGTAVSESGWGGPLAIGAVAFAVAYTAVLGGYFVSGTNAVILFAVLAAGIPAPDGALDSRLAGTLVGGALAAAASALLWPARPVRDAGRPLGRAARQSRSPATARSCAWSSTSIGCWSGSPDWCATGRPRPAPAGPSWTRPRPSSERRPRRSAASAPLDPVDLERSVRACAPQARAALAARLGVAEPATVAREAEEAAIAGDLAQAATQAALDAEIVAGRRPASVEPAVIQLLDEPVLEAAGRRLRANLTLRSVQFRNALRLGAALALAMALAHMLDLQHGFWVVLATLTVVRTTASATSVTARRAVFGTAVGFVLAIVVILGAEADNHLYVILLGPVICAAVYAARAGGVLAGQAGFTVLVVVLFSLLAPSDWTLALVRVQDVVAGALVGVAIGLVAWPRGAGGQLPAAVADVIEVGLGRLTGRVAEIQARRAGSRGGLPRWLRARLGHGGDVPEAVGELGG